MRYTRADVVSRRFGTSLVGYRKQEVTEFLSALVTDIDEQTSELRKLKESNAALQAEVDRFHKLEAAISHAMITAQQSAEEARAAANEEARLAIEAAQARAEALEGEAARNAENLRQQRQRFLREFRDLLQSHLDSVSGEMARRPDEEPARPTVTSLPPMQFTAKPGTDGVN